MQEQKIQPTDYAIVASILAIGTLLRTIDLDGPLWYDEILTLTRYVRLPLDELLSDYSSFNNHPFYSIQAKGAIRLFGESNWSLRLPAMIFGVASIGALWRLAYLVSGTLQAHVSALLLTFSYHHVWFSQNARGYTELMFWFLTSTIVLIRGIRDRSLKTWVLYGLLLAAGMYTHVTAAPFFLVHALIAAAILMAPALASGGQTTRVRQPTRRWLLPVSGFLVGGVVTMALYAPLVGQLLDNLIVLPGLAQTDAMVEYRSPLWTVMEVVRTVSTPGPLIVIVALVVLGLVAVGIAESRRREPILGWVLLLHLSVTLAVLLTLSARIWPRYFFADMAFVLFFLTQGVFAGCRVVATLSGSATQARLSGRTLFVMSALVMLIVSVPLLVRNYQLPKQDFDGALAYVESRRARTDAVVTLDLASSIYTDYFGMDWRPVRTAAELQTVRAGANRTWLVMAFPDRATRRFVGVIQDVNRHFSLAREFRGTLGDGSVIVYLDTGTSDRDR